jgi:hypothetical protein
MYLKIYNDKKLKDENFGLAFNESLVNGEKRAKKISNVFWEYLPNNVVTHSPSGK